MNFRLFLESTQEKKVTLTDVRARKMFGPLYHGTTTENHEKIAKDGFKVFVGDARTGETRHGYSGNKPYWSDIPAPVHHFGYGIYFTTNKSIATDYNQGTTKKLKTYFIDAPRFESINFANPKKMMDWWIANGYDAELAKANRVEATKKLTENLKSKYDAIWFKGKGLYRLLDGDQICVFDPSRIYTLDNSLASKGEPGSKVYKKIDGIVYRDYQHTGTILGNIRDAEPYRFYWNEKNPNVPHPWLNTKTKKIYEIKWNKGGIDRNAQDIDIEFA